MTISTQCSSEPYFYIYDRGTINAIVFYKHRQVKQNVTMQMSPLVTRFPSDSPFSLADTFVKIFRSRWGWMDLILDLIIIMNITFPLKIDNKAINLYAMLASSKICHFILCINDVHKCLATPHLLYILFRKVNRYCNLISSPIFIVYKH